jgi:hypothetical protein
MGATTTNGVKELGLSGRFPACSAMAWQGQSRDQEGRRPKAPAAQDVAGAVTLISAQSV